MGLMAYGSQTANKMFYVSDASPAPSQPLMTVVGQGPVIAIHYERNTCLLESVLYEADHQCR